MKIYTKTGDDGKTSLFRGGRVSKDSRRVAACGSVDELNCNIGWLRAHRLPDDQDKILNKIQHDLFRIGADLSTPEESVKNEDKVIRIKENSEIFMENTIDQMEQELSPLKVFIIPGGSPPAVALHVCRAVCRRAEREVIALFQTETINPHIIKYLNRLSDLMFVMARYMNKQVGLPDIIWDKDV